MAGHSKWHNIKHRKAAQDAKKAKIYAKLAKFIQLEAMKWADPSMNPGLALAISKAKSAWVPKPVIEKAIAKGSGQDTGEKLEEIFYEGYGPAGVALYIKCITSNKNRSASNVRAILTKYGWNMGQAGSVAWQFSPKGVIYVSWKVEKVKEKGKEVENIIPLDDSFEDILLETDIEDYELSEDGARIVTAREDLAKVTKFLEENNYKIESSEIEYVPENTVSLSEQDEEKLQKLIDALEEDDDVDAVYHNAG
jgi:YebC/PmpR family DNA-binding regulatory protein